MQFSRERSRLPPDHRNYCLEGRWSPFHLLCCLWRYQPGSEASNNARETILVYWEFKPRPHTCLFALRFVVLHYVATSDAAKEGMNVCQERNAKRITCSNTACHPEGQPWGVNAVSTPVILDPAFLEIHRTAQPFLNSDTLVLSTFSHLSEFNS